MSDGVRLCLNWNTKQHDMGGTLSRLTDGTHPPNAALIVDIFSTPYRLMSACGRALNVASIMIVISMLLRIYMPWGSRYLKPVESP